MVELAVPAMRVACRPAYGEMLLGFHAVVSPLERRLAGVRGLGHIVPELEARWRTPLLERDLAWLGLHPPPPLAPPLLPELTTTGEALGSLYVLEGSTLGGHVIARRLRQSLGLTPARGAAFFGARGSSLGPMWTAFIGALAAYVEGRSDDGTAGGARVEEELTRGATGTYRAFLRAFPIDGGPDHTGAG